MITFRRFRNATFIADIETARAPTFSPNVDPGMIIEGEDYGLKVRIAYGIDRSEKNSEHR
jgi:hypothetical protein